MKMVNQICETELKLHRSQYWPLYTITNVIILCALAGLNSVYNKV